MHTAISELDELIRQKLEPSEIKFSESVNGGFETVIIEIRTKVSNVRKYMLDGMEELQSKEATTLYVTHHATATANLCLLLGEYFEQAARLFTSQSKNVYRDILRRACVELDTFISFMQEQFRDYFDNLLPVPFCRIERAQAILKKQAIALAPLYKLEKTDIHLIDFALLPVRAIIKKGGTINFRHLDYLFVILEQLERILASKPKDSILAMHQALFTINFNHPDYIHYCIRKLHEKYGHLTYLEQLEEYHWYVKAQKQVNQMEGLALYPGQLSAVDQMDNYLQQEISYINTLIKMEAGYIDGIRLSENGHAKMQLNMSVKQAAGWLISLIDSKTLAPKSKLDAIHWFIQTFKTMGTDDMGFESFRSKFFNIDQATVSYIMELSHQQKEAMRGYPKMKAEV